MGNVCQRCRRSGSDSRLVVTEDASEILTPLSEEAEGVGEQMANSAEAESLVAGRNVRQVAHVSFPFTVNEQSVEWLRRNRVLFLLRGLPGSGKSTIAQVLRHLYPGAVLCSADAFFVNASTGQYEFDASRLKDAHTACNNSAFEAMGAGQSPVIVDNTNVRRWEFKFYTDLARRFGYKLIVVTPKTPWRFDAEALAAKTVHSVGLEVIEKRLADWEPTRPTYFAWFLDEAEAAGVLQLVRDFLDCLLRDEAARRRLTAALPHDGNAEELLLANVVRAMHATAKFCGHRAPPGSAVLVSQIDYQRRADVEEAVGRVFPTVASAVFVTPRTVGLKVDLTDQQRQLWDNDPAEPELAQLSCEAAALPPASRPHVTVATAEGVRPQQAGIDLLNLLAAAAAEPADEQPLLVTQWGCATAYGDAFLLALDQPLRLSCLFTCAF